MRILDKAKTLYFLHFFDLISTLLAINLGGIEYNKISLSIIEYHYLAYVIIKIFLILILYLLDKHTKVFKSIGMRLLLIILNIIYILVVSGNIIFIFAKLTGMI